MASIIFNSFMSDLAAGNIVPATDTYYIMLTTSAYTPSKTTHTKRADVTNEVVGTGYTAGGQAITCTPSLSGNNELLTFAAVNWTTATIAAAYGVIYKRRGGASSADNLVCVLDFGGTVSSTAGTFTVTPSSALTLAN